MDKEHRLAWIVDTKQPLPMRYAADTETTMAMAAGVNPNEIPMAELTWRFQLLAALNEGVVHLPEQEPEPLGGAEAKAWSKLRNCTVVTVNGYQGELRNQWMIYRMRLFSSSERSALRRALRKKGSGWECEPGCAGMMDELEMVNFETNGIAIKNLRRTI